MGLRNIPTPEQKAKVIELRKAGHSYAQITATTGIHRGTLFNIFKAAGLTKEYGSAAAALSAAGKARTISKPKTEVEVEVTTETISTAPAVQVTAPQVTVQNFCPKCAKAIVIAHAKFCYHCGAILLSEEEILAEELGNALRTLSQLGAVPSRSKDIIRDALAHGLSYLEKDK